VRIRHSASRKGASLDELVQFLVAKDMAKFKLPERLEIVSEFPVSTFGKVSRRRWPKR